MGKFSLEGMKKKKGEIKKQKEKQAERINFVRRHSAVDGKNIFRFKETNTGGEYPWEEMGLHYRCGPNKDQTVRCLRDVIGEADGIKDIAKCPQCVEVDSYYKKGGERYKALAGIKGRKHRVLLEGINLTSLVENFENDNVPDPKKCFGNFVFREEDEGFKKCKICINKDPWGMVCKSGLGYLTIGPTLGEPLVNQAYKIGKSLKHNPFSLKNGHNFEFNKSGEELLTKYSDIGFSLDSYNLPLVVKVFMKDNSLDWSRVYPKVGKEEMSASMEGVEPEIEDVEEEDLEEEEKETEEEEEVEEEDAEEEEETEEEEVEEEAEEEEEEEPEEEEEVEEEEEEEEEDEEFFKEIEDELEKEKKSSLSEKLKKQAEDKKIKIKKKIKK